MAFIHLDHLPETTKVQSPLNVIIPDPGTMNGIPVKDRKVLYLLHGLSDDGSAWQRYTSIETYAKTYGLVVVMPSFGRSFYLDQPNGQQYFTYLTDELPRYLDDVFGIIPQREKTFIAGLSMGGYGAIKAAFLHPELYFAAASFSGVLSFAMMAANLDDPHKVEFELLFSDVNQLPGSKHDPAVWLKQAVQKHLDLPKLYISCGLEDELLPMSRQFTSECQSLGVPLEYREETGVHDWYFWDKQIQEFLAFALENEK